MTKKDWICVLRDTLPVMTGYLVLGMGFGMIMEANGFGLLWSLSMSLFIYAGSMQYAAIGLLTGGASLLTVALTTLAVNARHLFYGISMVDRYKHTGLRKPYLMFALTDETYSLVCQTDKGVGYMFWVSVVDHFYWVTGTLLGAVLGHTLSLNTKGVEFSLTALFLTIFADQWLTRKDYFSAAAGVAITLGCLLLFGSDRFLIPSMLLITAVLLLRMGKEDAHER